MENFAWIFWCLVAIITLVAEISTTALISIWFVPAALITAALSPVIKSFLIEVGIFILLSAVFLYLFRGVYKKYIKRSSSENLNPIVGKTGKTVEEVSPTSGKVLIGDVYWKARSDETIKPDTDIKVTAVIGTTLKIERIKGE